MIRFNYGITGLWVGHLSVLIVMCCCGCGTEIGTQARRQSDAGGERGSAVDGGRAAAGNSGAEGGKDVAVSEMSGAVKQAFSIRLLCWNIESGGSDPQIIVEQVKSLGAYDVYAFTEFLPEAEPLFLEVLGADYELVMSRSGRNDRLVIAFDKRKFDLIKVFELKEINHKNRYRAPLVVQLKERNSGIEFNVMNNHLARGKERVRVIQAEQLVQWAREQLLPTVALGDYNLDYVFATGKGNSAFAPMIKDGVWKWVQPVDLIDTNWFDNPQSPDGLDDYPGSILDFAFVTGPAKDWEAICKVIVRDGDFPDDERTSDHRPFELTIAN